jgi:regulatory protein
MASEQRISAIEVQERRRNRRSIYINDKFVVGVDETVVADLHLHVGQQIGEDELRHIVHAELVSKAKERALKLLDYRQRSRSEISRGLARAGYEEDVIAEVLERLESMGLIDDAQFSRAWVNHRLSGKPMGKMRIKWELRQKGVPAEAAEEALAAVDADSEYESAREAARKRWEKDKEPDRHVKRRKLASFLYRQGFQWETINRVVSELSQEADNI